MDPVECEHCGQPVDGEDTGADEASGWFMCPHCGEMNFGDD